jgi:hypothetical protein
MGGCRPVGGGSGLHEKSDERVHGENPELSSRTVAAIHGETGPRGFGCAARRFARANRWRLLKMCGIGLPVVLPLGNGDSWTRGRGLPATRILPWLFGHSAPPNYAKGVLQTQIDSGDAVNFPLRTRKPSRGPGPGARPLATLVPTWMRRARFAGASASRIHLICIPREPMGTHAFSADLMFSLVLAARNFKLRLNSIEAA